MADGVEVRGNSVRVDFRWQGKRCKEPFPGPPTPGNLEKAARLVAIIKHEIQAGTFSYARYFPDSARVKEGTFGHWIDLWLDIKRNELAKSSMDGHESKINCHIRGQWGERQAEDISFVEMQRWVQKGLMPKLHNKTVREIVAIVRQIYQLYRTTNAVAFDPTEGIVIRLPDDEDPDPFERKEIDAILGTPSPGREQELALIKFMIWTGPRVSEAIALAWEDVDLAKGEVTFRRARVRSAYKVTKTRRSTRKVKLLKPALEALREQAERTEKLPKVEVETTDRDNRTVRKQYLRFVFHNSHTNQAYSTSDNMRNGWWNGHLKAAGVRHRGPNNCRHTFASQMLTSGVVPLDWIAEHMGHTSTSMIHKHYGKWISNDAADMTSIIERQLKL
ncbi:site-specific integrase [Stutzerimonas frequens]|uniref:site-specific integrase n=1 Tax=Stutzerimonas frequens TaxID=2968969 RepID=UPI002934D9B0|nr:site-specific integrase [Stutzerimonas frequens]WOC77670.1 site-specific integrase [Stutzerimonas frequens]